MFETGFNEVTVLDIIKAVKKRQVVFYDMNRGGRGINNSRVNQIVENFRADSIGQLTAGDFVDSFQLADGHHRVTAIMRRFDNGLMTQKDLESTLIVKVVPSKIFLTTYIDLNKCRSHTGSEKLANSDLKCGQLLDSIISQAGVEEEDVLQSFRSNLMDVIVAYNKVRKEKRDIRVDDVFSARAEVTRLLELPADASERVMYNVEQPPVADALAYAFEVFGLIKEAAQELTAGPTRNAYIAATKAPGLLVAMLIDHLSEQPQFTNRDTAKLAEAIQRDVYGVIETAGTVARRNRKQLRYDDLVCKLRTRASRKAA